MADVQRTIPFVDQVFTVNEAAEHLRVGRTFLYQMIAAGKVTPIKFGARTIISGREIQRMIQDAQAAASN